ncbi:MULTISPECIES: ABC transporter ATP-binding protein [Priestia]|jgi:ABC-2 type transport system ATP-binding protein|uniref:ABC transporter, ATP-binding protein n=1 Tax=Priestia megaterium (strain ATCC 12872 / QMB1551) TaxID=545693 RepID=D5DZR0_PRIM1|nr:MULTISPECIES: ABC transporter ATP-binding protein [Priestia]ADE70461.1 ABC transporter, ATP-binding protein [Priestia megaterium QM B1551]MBG9932297.1 multidrug ABC transporter ATP-binding protein [Priestia aryabhattai]MDC7781294.1 ABC transporter ATP-binding protein [Priestia megaterium]MED4089582.1 ABC transporter ATP-binding protein [Priestia megaterium]MUL30493.1 ABC transporter ATP-binding protein YtrB [Priestia megaterium]
MTNLLEVRNIAKSFGQNEVLKDVSFHVPPGSIVGFIGDNGAGKSTTFKAVLGLISRDSGTVEIFGEDNLNKNATIKEDIGVVFDAINLPVSLTIKQLNKVFKSLFNSWDEADFYRLIRSFSLPEDKKIHTFSRGMSMKLSLAVALSHRAKLLLLDEATGGLDPSSREQILDELKAFVSDGNSGILLSSHIISDVEKIASHLVVIKNGEVLLNEEKEKVFREYAIAVMNEEQLNLLPEDIVVAKRTYDKSIRVLVSDKHQLPDRTLTEPMSMEELSVLLTRSER